MTENSKTNPDRVTILRTGDLSPVVAEVLKVVDKIQSNFDHAPLKILVKPNVVAPFPPERGVTTNPALVHEICGALKGLGHTVSMGDCPGGNPGKTEETFRRAGFLDLCGDNYTNIGQDAREVFFPCRECGKLFLAGAALEADLIISMPRFKTSSYQFLTGAVKNLYGVIPGTQKMRIHREFPERDDFAGMLIDLASLLPPRIAVIDGGLVMEGNGPIHGDIRRENLYIVSNSIFAADYAMALMMGYDPEMVPTVRLSSERGLLIQEEIEFNPPGAPESLPDFVHPVTFSGGAAGDADAMDASVREMVSVRVTFDEDSCVQCGLCAENCPTGSIKMNPYPVLSQETCISCFCCNELCPTGAARLEKDLENIWSEAMKNEAGQLD